MKIAIIGNGQQGSSIARALDENTNHDVNCFDINEENRDLLKGLTANTPINHHANISDAIIDADIIILATPINEFSNILQSVSSELKEGIILTDIGSGKVKSITEIKDNIPEGAFYIPAHPIAGNAQAGPQASDSEMYRNETIVVVPQPGSDLLAAQKVIENLWTDIGANIVHMDAMSHDRLYGTISHFEHVIAFSLTAVGNDVSTQEATEEYKRAGDSLRDTTRIAGGTSADMWVPIFRDNNAAIMMASQGFTDALSDIKKALKSSAPTQLKNILNNAHAFRSGVEEERPRETLAGEIHDIAKEYKIDGVNPNDPLSVKNSFNKAAQTSLVKRTLLPTAIAAAITLNAQETEESHLIGIDIRKVANPSFKDGSAPMLNDPDYLTNLLFDNKNEVLEAIDGFEKEFFHLNNAIYKNDEVEIRSYLTNISDIRLSMPAHRDPKDMRDEFITPDAFFKEHTSS